MKLRCFTLAMCVSFSAVAEVDGLIQLSAHNQSEVRSWQNHGTGILRFDDSDAQFHIQQGILRHKADLGSAFSSEIVLNYYPDGEKNVGLTQAFVEYKPLSSSPWNWQAKAGFFYPEISLENTDMAWLSPYTYTNSAINSWIGEELRIGGAEFAATYSGRKARSPHSLKFVGGLFRGNDPAGTQLSWRGWALHDRQSLHHDRLNFARYPSVVDYDKIWHPAWVEPFREIDNRTGYYIGLHWRYLQEAQVRYYRYDNRADPTALDSDRIYAWHTKFDSISVQYRVNSDLRVIAQWMDGTTGMGKNHAVYVGFDSSYLMASYQYQQHKISIRYDDWRVEEMDYTPSDYNTSGGYGWTTAWRYDFNHQWEFGVEYVTNINWAKNRSYWMSPRLKQKQWMMVAQYRF